MSRPRVRRIVPVAGVMLAVLCALGAGEVPEQAGDESSEAARSADPAALPEVDMSASDDPHEALLAEGWAGIKEVDFLKARLKFRRAIETAVDEGVRAEAFYGLGVTWQVREPGADAARAAELYEQVFTDFAGTRAAPWAMLARARLADTTQYEKDRDVAAARRLYERILETWPDHYVADEAALRLAQTYLEKAADRDAQDRGAAILERRLADRPDNALVGLMHSMLADFAASRKRYREAVNHWIASDEAGIPSLEIRVSTYYQIASFAEHHLEDYALAAKWYERIVTDIRLTNKYYVAKMAAERCRRLAGERAEGERKDEHPGAKEAQP